MTSGAWVRANEHVLTALCVVVVVAFGAAVPLIGWTVGLGAVVGAVGWVAVLAVSNRAERREHDARDRDVTRRPM